MKNGLVLEGGGMRSLFSEGVFDVLLENGIKFDGAIGVSAGTTIGRISNRVRHAAHYGITSIIATTGGMSVFVHG